MSAPPRPELNDDWSQWLAYANWLTAQGDVRGQLLVLESQLALDPENSERQLEFDLHADAWYEDEHGISDDDDQMLYLYLKLVQGMRRFGNQVPPAFSALLTVPASRLIAIAARGENLEGHFSPILEQHEKKVHQGLIDWIEQAFDGIPAPGEGHLTLYQAEAADDYAKCDRSRDHLGRWQELPEQHLLDCQWALAYLDEQGIAYYLPAVMCFACRYSFASPDGWLTESLSYKLAAPEQCEYFKVLSWQQRATVCAYAAASGDTDAFNVWIQLIEAEKEVALEDWYTILTETHLT